MITSPTSEQIRQLADICANLGQVCAGSIVIPALFFDQKVGFVWIGTLSACACWAVSLYLIKKAKELASYDV